MNVGLLEFDNWNEISIKKRANILIKDMLNIWTFPNLTNEVLSKYEEQKVQQGEYTIKSMTGGHFLEEGKIKELFELFRTKVMNIDPEIKEEFLKFYIAYKVDTNFVDVVPQKTGLKLSLNTDIDKLHDPKNLCLDTTGIGKLGNGNVKILLHSKDQLEDVLDLVRQSYDINL